MAIKLFQDVFIPRPATMHRKRVLFATFSEINHPVPFAALPQLIESCIRHVTFSHFLMNISVLEQKRCVFVPANRFAAVLCCFKLGISFLRKFQFVPLEHIFDSEAFGILGARKKLIPSGASGAIAYLCAFSPALGNVQLFNNTYPENPAVPAGALRSKLNHRDLNQLTYTRVFDSFHVVSFPG
nr:MAG TPA: hypothetical protein [Caudoviricetes sp.]